MSADDRGGRSAGREGSDGDERPEALTITFDPPSEVFATDNGGAFVYPLLSAGKGYLDLGEFDECRLVFSVWHPSERRSIDLDRAYVELRGSFDAEEERWTRIAEIEPVVPPYGSDSFDGWIVLPVLAPVTAFALFGAGFEARSRIQVRGSAYFVP